MPRFVVRATDATGKPRRVQIDAADGEQALEKARLTGLRAPQLEGVEEAVAVQPPVPAPLPPPGPARAVPLPVSSSPRSYLGLLIAASTVRILAGLSYVAAIVIGFPLLVFAIREGLGLESIAALAPVYVCLVFGSLLHLAGEIGTAVRDRVRGV